MPQPRTHLPIPSAARTGLITYDAKDPDSTYPPIEQLRPPAGAPNVLLILLKRCRVRCVERVRRPMQDVDGGTACR